jgi:FAD:protein FMN transferase
MQQSDNDTTYGFSFSAMGGSHNEIRIAAPDHAQAHGLAQLAIREVERIEQKFSRYRPDSALSQLNARAPTQWAVCDDETISLLQFGAALFEASHGLFDLSSGVLRRAWNFRDGVLPSTSTLEGLLTTVGWQHIQIKSNQIRFDKPDMELDFGGIGKEYAADRAAGALMAAGVTHGFVNLGGDLAVIGPQPDGLAWSIAIPAPREVTATLASIEVSRGGLATSGDYERFMTVNGKRYCHILNPKTGFPVSYWQSVTVLAPTAAVAGSCCTIAMLLEDKGLNFLRESGFHFLAVDQNHRVHRFPKAK